jgi:hypothetical protein
MTYLFKGKEVTTPFIPLISRMIKDDLGKRGEMEAVKNLYGYLNFFDDEYRHFSALECRAIVRSIK